MKKAKREKNKAATKIQARWKGNKARKSLKEKRKKRKSKKKKAEHIVS